MEKKKQTTMRFTAQDLEDLKKIRETYGCSSDTAAVRLALRMLARDEQPQQRKPPRTSPR